jgi:hypothetical protein
MPTSGQQRTVKILVIDDNESNRVRVQSALQLRRLSAELHEDDAAGARFCLRLPDGP